MDKEEIKICMLSISSCMHGRNENFVFGNLPTTVIIFWPVFWTWDAPRIIIVQPNVGILTLASNVKIWTRPFRVLLYIVEGYGLLWFNPKIVGNMSTWENTENRGSSQKGRCLNIIEVQGLSSISLYWVQGFYRFDFFDHLQVIIDRNWMLWH